MKEIPDSASLVGWLCEQVGMPVKDVYSTREVIDLCDRLEYAVDRAVIAEAVRKEWIPAVERGEWDAAAIHELVAALETRRRWQPGSTKHRHKKTGAQLEYEEQQAAGNAAYFADIGRYALEDLLLMLTRTDDRMLREALLVAVRHKLKTLEVNE